MNKFKIGDKVVCVEANKGSKLEKGKTYIVTDVEYSYFLSLEGLEGSYYSVTRFELIEEEN